jgi:hypothetical protein
VMEGRERRASNREDGILWVCETGLVYEIWELEKGSHGNFKFMVKPKLGAFYESMG